MFVYILQSQEDGYYKIGVSKNPQKRLSTLQTGNPSELKLINIYESKNAKRIEKKLHSLFSSFKKEGEWFDFGLMEELSFIEKCKLIDDNIEFIKKHNYFGKLL